MWIIRGLTVDLSHPSHVYEKIVKQVPYVVAGVDLLHFHLCIHIAVVDEIYIGNFHLRHKTAVVNNEQLQGLSLTNYCMSMSY